MPKLYETPPPMDEVCMPTDEEQKLYFWLLRHCRAFNDDNGPGFPFLFDVVYGDNPPPPQPGIKARIHIRSVASE